MAWPRRARSVLAFELVHRRNTKQPRQGRHYNDESCQLDSFLLLGVLRVGQAVGRQEALRLHCPEHRHVEASAEGHCTFFQPSQYQVLASNWHP